MEQLAEQYAQLKGTKVIASKINLDGTITFVLESGPKLTMSTRQLEEANAELTHAKELDQAVEDVKANFKSEDDEETPVQRRQRLKAEAKPRK